MSALATDLGTDTVSEVVDTGTQTETVDTQSSPEITEGTQDGQQTETPTGKVNFREIARAASEAMPEQAANIREMANRAYKLQAHEAIFKTPQEAQSTKQLLDGIGGVEGATRLQERSQQYDAQDSALKEGNPEVLDGFFKDFPEGAAALAPAYLERLQKANPDAFISAIAPHAIGLLENAGVGKQLALIQRETDPVRKDALIKELSDWYGGQKTNLQQTLQTQQAKDPRAEKLTEQQKSLDTEKEQIFADRVSEKVNSTAIPALQKTVETYAKQYKWTDDQKTEFQNRLQADIVAQMNGDASYKQQVDLRKANKSRTHDSVASYIAGEFTRRLGDKDGALATAAKFNKLIGKQTAAPAGNGVVKAGGPATAPGGQPFKVSAQPPDTDIDWNKPDGETAQLNYIKGRGYTKAGKFVQWR